ncbi:LytR C-terminal domain-containing protein, partial [Dietzia sp. CQ4]
VPGQPAEPAAPPAGGQPGGAPAVTSVPVQVFNNSNVSGLAGRTGEALRESGFAVGEVANLPSNRPVVSESTVYFGTGAGERQAAEAVAAQLGIPALPRPADLEVGTPGVIVIVTQDLDR